MVLRGKKAFATALALVSLWAVAIPAQAAQSLLETDFEDGANVFSSGAWGMNSLEDGHEGAGLNSIIPEGAHWGSSGHWNFAAKGIEEPDELWWRYWIKFPEGFYIQSPSRGKLPGPAGLYTYNCLGGRASTPEEPCWSARMLFSRLYASSNTPDPDGPDDQTLLGFYAYHLDGPTDRGDILTWDPEVALLDHGQWYCVEGRVKMNTPEFRNGVLEGWVDGALAFSRTDLGFRRAGEDWMHVKSFWFDVYYGGSEASPVDNQIHFDSLSVGLERQGCDDAATWNGKFRDDDDSQFEADIEWLAATEITRGCNPPLNNKYCPQDPVTRGQMAAFLSRAFNLPVASRDYFSDDDGATFEADINRLAEAGITKGCTTTSFCSDSLVTREQMAAFLVRAYGYTDPGAFDFTDDDGSTFEADINRLAQAGITRGCNPPDNTRFCPSDPVTREQMAAFLHRAEG